MLHLWTGFVIDDSKLSQIYQKCIKNLKIQLKFFHRLWNILSRLPGYEIRHVLSIEEFKLYLLYFSLISLYAGPTAEIGKDIWCFFPICTKYIAEQFWYWDKALQSKYFNHLQIFQWYNSITLNRWQQKASCYLAWPKIQKVGCTKFRQGTKSFF